MERLTKRINLGNGKTTVDFSNSRVGEFLTDHKAGVTALFEKLAEYEDLEEQGKLPKLPCVVGDEVCTIRNGKISSFRVSTIRIGEYGIFFCNEIFICGLKDFGKTAFLTREEAEAALEEKVKKDECRKEGVQGLGMVR